MTKAQASKTKTATPSLAQLADELGALEKEYSLALAPLEFKLPRMKALKEMLQAACPAAPAKEWIVEGARFGVKLGPCANESTIHVLALVKKIGAAAFVRFAGCTLKALKANVKPEIFDAVTSTEQTGARKLTTYEKGVA